MRNLISTIICGFVVFVLVSCEKEKDVPVTSVTIGQATAEMLIGETVQLSATVLPSDASDKTVSWASSKQSVATISNTGLVTAIAEGTSTITASAGEKSGTCTITVSNKDIEVSSVTLNKTSAKLKVGEKVTLTATVKPDDATDKTVTWTTSDATVASVSNSGLVTAKKVGKATITAKAGDKSATCAITVTTATSVTLNKTSAKLKVGEKVTLTATVKPDDATDKTVTWTTSDATVASVSNSGLVTAKKVGKATITAKAGDKSATCAITVVKTLVTSLSFQHEVYYLGKGEYRTLEYSISPDDATDRSVVWSSSNPKYVSVDQNGKVTAMSSGSTSIITVSARDGSGKKANCLVVACPCPGYTVDLGLGTVYWAVANLNVAFDGWDDYYGYFCEDPENIYDFYGDYFAWGERVSKSKYDIHNYGFINKDKLLTKYVLFGSDSGSPDGKSILEPEDDIATLSLGGKRRIPTQSEWSQLLTKCVWKWTTNWGGVRGKNGYIVTGPNGNSIFLPITGRMYDINTHEDMGYYWSSSLSNIGNSWNACCVSFNSDEVYEDISMRCWGLSIRPVWKE